MEFFPPPRSSHLFPPAASYASLLSKSRTLPQASIPFRSRNANLSIKGGRLSFQHIQSSLSQPVKKQQCLERVKMTQESPPPSHSLNSPPLLTLPSPPPLTVTCALIIILSFFSPPTLTSHTASTCMLYVHFVSSFPFTPTACKIYICVCVCVCVYVCDILFIYVWFLFFGEGILHSTLPFLGELKYDVPTSGYDWHGVGNWSHALSYGAVREPRFSWREKYLVLGW